MANVCGYERTSSGRPCSIKTAQGQRCHLHRDVAGTAPVAQVAGTHRSGRVDGLRMVVRSRKASPQDLSSSKISLDIRVGGVIDPKRDPTPVWNAFKNIERSVVDLLKYWNQDPMTSPKNRERNFELNDVGPTVSHTSSGTDLTKEQFMEILGRVLSVKDSAADEASSSVSEVSESEAEEEEVSSAAEETGRCETCFDAVTKSKGVTCSKGHFQCDTCVDMCVASQSDTKSESFDVNLWKQNKGRVSCPFIAPEASAAAEARDPGRCGYRFSDLTIARHVYPSTWKIYRRSRNEYVSRAERRKTETQIAGFVSFEISRLAEMSELDRMVDRLYRNITEDVMILKCPCGAAFADFDGCLALKCASCGGYFCALCLRKCPNSNEAHSHVAECGEGKKYGFSKFQGLFFGKQRYDEFQQSRRLDLAKRRIRECSDLEDVRNRLAIMVAKDLFDINADERKIAEFVNSIMDYKPSSTKPS